MKLDNYDLPIWDALHEKISALEFFNRYFPGHGIINEGTLKQQKIGIKRYLTRKQETGEISDEEKLKFDFERGNRLIEKSIEMSLAEYDDQTPAMILKKLGLNVSQWKLLWYETYHGSWTTTTKNLAHEAETHPNYTCRIKAKVEPIANMPSDDTLKELFEGLKSQKLETYKYVKGNNLVKLPIVDFHLGNCPLDVSINLYKNLFLEIFGRLEQRNIRVDRFQYLLGHDYFNSESDGKTSSGKVQVENYTPNWDEIYRTGIELFYWSTEHLRKIAPVEILYIKGNHSERLSYTLAMLMYYKYLVDNPKSGVTVDIEYDNPRKYSKYGITSWGDSHGREDKRNLKTIMQEESPYWSETEYREFHLADLHHERVIEDGGIIFRRLPSITKKDRWTIGKGYTAKRRAEVLVYNQDYGLDDILNFNVRADWQDKLE